MKKLLSCILIVVLLGVDNLTFALVGNEGAIDLCVIEIQNKAPMLE
jgi:hypothetical protein